MDENEVHNDKPVQSASPPPAEQELTVQQALELAVQQYTAGHLPEAEGIFQQILRHAGSDRSVAKVLLGVIAQKVDRNYHTVIPHNIAELPQSVISPQATYSPWLNDENFESAYKAASGNTLVCLYRAYELWQLVEQVAHLQGDVLEVGVWRGGTGLVIAEAMRSRKIEATLFLADSFTGVVKAGSQDTTYKGGEHSDTSIDIVRDLFARYGIGGFEILSGVFPDETASRISDRRFRFCHIDVDTHDSAKDVFEWIWPRLVHGGVVVFDDYGFKGCEGVTQLVNDERGRKDALSLYNLNGHAVLVKMEAT